MTLSSITREFHGITGLAQLVCDVERDWRNKEWRFCWFRGTSTSNSLLPGQYRKTYNSSDTELSIFLEFQQRARGFIQKDLNDWELFFLMQHFRVPTRLLDWTENSLVALYFALVDSSSDGDPCIWMLNAKLFNANNAPDKTPSIVVNPDSTDPRLKFWINAFHPLNFNPSKTQFTDANGKTDKIENPMAMSPPTIDARVIAQRSVFTLHGCRLDPIDTCCVGHQEPQSDFIRRFVFKGNKEEVLGLLRCFGITRQAIFPDLEGLGLELRHRLTN